MPFWKKNSDRPSKKEIESMQDGKLSLAENLPAHVQIVDLSHVYLKELPYGVLSIIKHQNKDCLILKNNEIKELKGDLNLLEDLKKLDLSFNMLKSVTRNFTSCQALVNLNLDHNELRTLPSLLGCLSHLETLSASSNQISSIAPEIGALPRLTSLLLKDNQITKIPDNFAHCYRLVHLEVDVEKVVYPPGEVVMRGGRATVLWLCEENNVDKSQVEESRDEHVTKFAAISAEERQAEEMILKRQEHEAEEAAEILRKIKEEEEQMRRMSQDRVLMDERRKQLLQKKMAEQEAVEHDKLSKYLRFQDDVKWELIREALKEVEDKDLDANRILAEVEAMFEEEKRRLEEYLKEEEHTFKEYMSHNALDLAYIEREMAAVLQEDQMMDSFARNAERELEAMFRMVREEEGAEQAVHKKMAHSFEQDRKHMLQMIMQDEDLQRKMFITAQQEHDRVYKALAAQIENVQENLILLTILEKSEQAMEEAVVAGVHSQRTEMAELLTRLMVKQEERRTELEETARIIEQQLQDEQANFWLYQYQMLMASKPAKVLREEEEAIVAARKASQLEKPLQDDEYQGPAVLPDAWNNTEPSAPAETTTEPPTAPLATTPTTAVPSAPLIRHDTAAKIATIGSETECCICLDAHPSVAFLPCGHVCCCAGCGIVSICPMCRAEITQTVKLYFTQT